MDGVRAAVRRPSSGHACNVHVPCCLQDGRDFADVMSPKLSFIFNMASGNSYYLHAIQHLVEGDTGKPGGHTLRLRFAGVTLHGAW